MALETNMESKVPNKVAYKPNDQRLFEEKVDSAMLQTLFMWEGDRKP